MAKSGAEAEAAVSRISTEMMEAGPVPSFEHLGQELHTLPPERSMYSLTHDDIILLDK